MCIFVNVFEEQDRPGCTATLVVPPKGFGNASLLAANLGESARFGIPVGGLPQHCHSTTNNNSRGLPEPPLNHRPNERIFYLYCYRLQNETSMPFPNQIAVAVTSLTKRHAVSAAIPLSLLPPVHEMRGPSPVLASSSHATMAICVECRRQSWPVFHDEGVSGQRASGEEWCVCGAEKSCKISQRCE